MPVTVKFSEQFYKTFGHEQVDELVNWCNQLDTGYRSEFRELFELNFARFDAKLEQRIAEVKAELRQETAGLEIRLRQEIVQASSELRQEIAELRGDMRAGLAGVESRLTMRMFLFWVATVGVFFAQKLFS